MKKDDKVMQVVGTMDFESITLNFYGSIEEPLFYTKEVAVAIDYSKRTDGTYNTTRLMSLCPFDSMKLTCKIRTSGQVRDVKMITEQGLYIVLSRCNAPKAEPFLLSVTNKLKQIRLTGGYIQITEQDTQEDVKRKAQEIAEKTIKAKDTIIADLKTTNRLLCKDITELTDELEKKCKDIEALGEHIDWIKDSANEAYKSGLYGVMAFEDAYELLEPSMVGFNKFRQFLVDKGVLYYEKTSTYLPTKDYRDMFFRRHENNNRLRIKFTTIGNAVEFIQLYKEYMNQIDS